VTIPLSFLKPGRHDVQLWSDGPSPTDLVPSSSVVQARDTLTLTLAAAGGAAAIITPAR
jgi:alpha-glucosidase